MKKRSETSVDIYQVPLEKSLSRHALELCWEIEKFPASVHQTNTIIMASALFDRLRKLEEAVKSVD